MYRWNSRVPTVRWKDNCLSDRGTTKVTTEDTIDAPITNIYSKTDSSNSSDISNGCNGTGNSNSCVGSGSNLSGSTLTSADPITLPKPAVLPEVNGRFSSSENLLCNFDTTKNSVLVVSSNSATETLDSLSAHNKAGGTGSLEATGSSGIVPTSDNSGLAEFSSGGTHWNWNVIRAFLSFVRIVVREIRTLSIALLIGLLVNPINYCICWFSPTSSSRSLLVAAQPLLSSIRRLEPGGSSTSYYCCKRRNIKSSGGGNSRNSITSAFSSLIRLPCCCTCNCISFLRPILGGGCGRECCSGVTEETYKDNCTRSGHTSCSSCCRNSFTTTTHHCCVSKPGVGKPKRGLGKMAQILSKTMTLLGVAFVIHFIIMSTLAEREGKQKKSALKQFKPFSYQFHIFSVCVLTSYKYVCIHA